MKTIAHLVTEGVSTDDNRLYPAGYRLRHPGQDDRFAEDCTTEDVSNLSYRMINKGTRPKRKGTHGTVGALPHLFQVELFHSGLIGCNGCTFNSDLVFNDRVSRVNSDLIICL